MSNEIVNITLEEYIELKKQKEKLESAIELIKQSQKYIENYEFNVIISDFIELTDEI